MLFFSPSKPNLNTFTAKKTMALYAIGKLSYFQLAIIYFLIIQMRFIRQVHAQLFLFSLCSIALLLSATDTRFTYFDGTDPRLRIALG